MDAPSIEFIRHTATTGAAAPTAEGAIKPEVVFEIDALTAKAVKLAANNALSWEVILDWPAFQSYCGAELYKQVIDTENDQLLSGDGTGESMTGFYSTSGILVHDAAGDTGTGETKLDSVEKAITNLRTGPALATADLLVLHPTDWSDMRRTKDSQERCRTQPDPTVG
jgi:HK97 family phage major capsid protein